jgi:hypothetical protein
MFARLEAGVSFSQTRALPMRSSIGCCIVGLLLAVMLCQSQQGGGVGGGPAGGPPGGSAGTTSGGNPGGSPAHSSHNTGPQNQDLIYISPNELQERSLQEAHEQNLEDTSRLVKLSQELKWDLANHDREVLSLATVKKMDEIERLIKKIRSRVGKK